MKLTILILASWIFLPSRYSNTPPVRPFVAALDDPREVTRGYSYSRTFIGDSVYYRVYRY